MILSQTIKSQTGFTLIELMITITVLSILIFIGSSLTTSWIDRSQVNSTATQFKNAVSTAKVAAVRNPNSIALNATAVTVCIDSNTKTLNVIRLASPTATLCSSSAPNTLLQQVQLPAGIRILQGNATLQCLRFNADGMLNTSTGSACSVHPTFNFKVEKNNESADLEFM